MKKSIAALFLVTSLSAFAATAPKSIAVLPISLKGSDGFWIHINPGKVQDVFVTELRQRTKLNVIDGSAVRKLVDKSDIPLSEKLNKTQAVRVGKLLGVNYLLTGSVTEYGAEKGTGKVVLNARLIDTSTGEVVWADEVKVSVGGFGGGVDDNRLFDKALKPCVQKAVSAAKAKLR